MKYTLDSNVAMKWVVPESDTPKALRLRSDFRKGVHELIAPDIFPIEVAHALARAERRGIIQPPIGTRRLFNVLAASPKLYPYLPLLPRAFAIASAFRHGVYDCLYIALAERENCELITTDDALVRKFQPQFPFIVPLSALP